MTDPNRTAELLCPHSETTAEDGDGYAICLRCNARVIVRLTAALFERQLAAMRRAS